LSAGLCKELDCSSAVVFKRYFSM